MKVCTLLVQDIQETLPEKLNKDALKGFYIRDEGYFHQRDSLMVRGKADKWFVTYWEIPKDDFFNSRDAAMVVLNELRQDHQRDARIAPFQFVGNRIIFDVDDRTFDFLCLPERFLSPQQIEQLRKEANLDSALQVA